MRGGDIQRKSDLLIVRRMFHVKQYEKKRCSENIEKENKVKKTTPAKNWRGVVE